MSPWRYSYSTKVLILANAGSSPECARKFTQKIGIPMHRQTSTVVSSQKLLSWHTGVRCNPAIRRDWLKYESTKSSPVDAKTTYSAISG